MRMIICQAETEMINCLAATMMILLEAGRVQTCLIVGMDLTLSWISTHKMVTSELMIVKL